MAKQHRKKQGAARRKAAATKAVKSTAKRAAARKKLLKKTGAQPAALPASRLLLAANPMPAVAQGGDAAPNAAPKARAFSWRGIVWPSGAVLAALLAVWVLGNILFPSVQLGNVHISARLGDGQLAQAISTQTAAYRLAVVYPDKQRRTFSLADIGLHIDAGKTVRGIRSQQHSALQRLLWWRPMPAELRAGANAATLYGFIAQHASIVTAPAKDASITLDNGEVRLSPGQPGKQFGLNNAVATILSAALQQRTTPLILSAVPLEPSVGMPALASAKSQLEAVLHQKISIHIGAQTVEPSPADIASWLSLTPTSTSVDVSVNDGALHDYLSSIASDKTAPARSQITDTSGAVLAAGVQGAVVGNTDDAQGQISTALLKGAGADVSLPARLTPFKTVVSPGDGKWVEVDLSTKRMYAYDDNSVTRSFLVSAGAAATPTVTGRYAIYAKYRSQDMFGENADGSNYFQPNVPYVNYFYRDYAIHGNYWRPASYFGNINSSHGCVGINVGDGAWMYSWAPVGTPVVVHY
ncbi:MAG TPA: L,D-transpeptidase family protein [Candidatus Saccharimonadales bacterium]|nr:L,D-transpeptidase family protein [Candidatus Saccharimonadales bacterium]